MAVDLDDLESRLRHSAIDRDAVRALFAASADTLRSVPGEPPIDTLQRRDRVTALAHDALSAFDVAERETFALSLLKDSADVSLLCLLLRKGPDGESDLFGAGTPAVSAALQPHVEALVAQGGLWRQAVPAAVLWFWWSLAQEDRVYAFVKAAFRDPPGLAAVLDMVVEPDGAGGDRIAVRRWSKIVDFSGLEAAALPLALNGATREARRRARRFLDAFGNGKSELFR